MKLGLAQMECRLGDVAGNVRKMIARIEEAARLGCDAVLLPEMADTGYDMSVIARCASSWDQAPLSSIRETARRSNITVICGLSERADGKIYNSAAVVDPRGELAARYRKMHLFRLVGEDHCFAAGDDPTVHAIGDFRAGLMICYDLRFPELSRAQTSAGAELLILVAAWPEKRIEHWRTLCAARAIENQCFVAAVNRVGQDGEMVFGGRSIALDPWGRVLAEGGQSEELLIVDLEREVLDEIRRKLPFLDDRRPEFQPGRSIA